MSQYEHEGVERRRPPDIDRAGEIGDFALQAWEKYEHAELGNRQTERMVPRQLINAAKRFQGKLSSYALDLGIRPPEAAILDLPEVAARAAFRLVREALDIDAGAKKRTIHSTTATRLESLLEYDMTEIEESDPSMTLGEVVRRIDIQDEDLRYINALERVRQDMEWQR